MNGETHAVEWSLINFNLDDVVGLNDFIIQYILLPSPSVSFCAAKNSGWKVVNKIKGLDSEFNDLYAIVEWIHVSWLIEKNAVFFR